MKSIILLIIYFVVGGFALADESAFKWTESMRRQEALTIQSWKEVLAASKNLSAIEKSERLWSGLKNMGGRITWPQHDPEIEVLYDSLQKELISSPGYIDFFTDALEQERKKMEHKPPGGGFRPEYTRRRMWYILDTFPHLPGPETIRVLGNYLYDERDVPPPPRPGQDWGDIPANSVLASSVLMRIGLVDGPKHNISAQKKWWTQVEAGKRWFAFYGQPVSYRFRLDGSVETKPRDTSRDPRWIAYASYYNFNPEPDVSSAGYWWVGGGVAAVLLAGGITYIARRRKSDESDADASA